MTFASEPDTAVLSSAKVVTKIGVMAPPPVVAEPCVAQPIGVGSSMT